MKGAVECDVCGPNGGDVELGRECLFIGGVVAAQLAAVVWDAQAVDSTRDLDDNEGSCSASSASNHQR